MPKPRVALFIPCYINTLFPNVGMATLTLLERFGYAVEYPEGQTCCGQPFANSGAHAEAKPLAEHFVRTFSGYDYIVAPSASCVATVRNHYDPYVGDDPAYAHIKATTYELLEFLHDVVRPEHFGVSFPHSVTLHQSCHGLRELELGVSSELMLPYHNKVLNLLRKVDDIELREMERADECCGFGGTFSVHEPEISTRMGTDKLDNAEATEAEYLAGFDSSCLMHLRGIASRQNRKIRFVHVAEILAGTASGNEE
jgi:L-lactate dehydrogenase complex protein LldE